MTLADFGTIASIVSAAAVVVTLIYLARQVGHANKLAQMQTREQMVQMVNEELRILIDDPEMGRRFIKPGPLDFTDTIKLYNFLTLAIRHREWEWYQAHNGAIGKADAEQVKRDCFEVANLWLGYPRARAWWETAGRFGLNPQFAAEIDAYLEGRPHPRFVESLMELEAGMAQTGKQQASASKRTRARAKK